jgi:hypothetical protein
MIMKTDGFRFIAQILKFSMQTDKNNRPPFLPTRPKIKQPNRVAFLFGNEVPLRPRKQGGHPKEGSIPACKSDTPKLQNQCPLPRIRPPLNCDSDELAGDGHPFFVRHFHHNAK